MGMKKQRLMKKCLIIFIPVFLVVLLIYLYAGLSPGPNGLTLLLFREGLMRLDKNAVWVSEDEDFYFYESDADRRCTYGRIIYNGEVIEIRFGHGNRLGPFWVERYDSDEAFTGTEDNLFNGRCRFHIFDKDTLTFKCNNFDTPNGQTKVEIKMHRRAADEWKREMEADPRWGGPEPDIGPEIDLQYKEAKSTVWVAEDDSMYFYMLTETPRLDGEIRRNGEQEEFYFRTSNRVFMAYSGKERDDTDPLFTAIYRIGGENDDVLTLTSCSGILAGEEPVVFRKKNVEEWEKGEGISLLGPPLGLRENVVWVSENGDMHFYEKSEGKPDYYGCTEEGWGIYVFCPYAYRMLFGYRYDPENPKEIQIDPQNTYPTSRWAGRPDYAFRYRISPDGETLTLENRSRYEDEWKIKVLHKVNADQWRAETGTGI